MLKGEFTVLGMEDCFCNNELESVPTGIVAVFSALICLGTVVMTELGDGISGRSIGTEDCTHLGVTADSVLTITLCCSNGLSGVEGTTGLCDLNTSSTEGAGTAF